MKNDTSQILSELKSIVSSKPEEPKSIIIKKKKSEASLAIGEIIDKIKVDAEEEKAFEDAKKTAHLNYLNDEKRKQELLEQKKIASQIAEMEQERQKFILNKSNQDDTPPTPLPLFDLEPLQLSHLDLSTQMLNFKDLNRKSNLALLHKFKAHFALGLFVLSLLLFYETSSYKQKIIHQSTAKITMPVKIHKTVVSKPIELNLWPNYVWEDVFSNISPDAPDLIFKNLYSNSIETNKELNRDKTGASGDKKVIKKIKKVIIKKEKIQFNMHEQD
jgi:hypothetical protein